MISKDKIEKIQNINNDDADFILKIYSYLNYVHNYMDTTNIFENLEALKEKLYQIEQGVPTLFLVFSNNELNLEDLNFHIAKNNKKEILDLEKSYYAGKNYEVKIHKYQEFVQEDLKEKVKNVENVAVIIDISSVSSFPLWNTMMRRRMTAIIKELDKLELNDIDKIKLRKIIRESMPESANSDGKYDIDLLIEYMKMASALSNVSFYLFDSEKSNESIFLANEIIKYGKAILLEKEERYEYIYDVTCKDLDEMFSKYGFCNFKENKCVAQRHKTLFNRYPVPKTDGCCFKIVRKCEHNNKDGTCKVKCLPCKLFTCPYLGKLHIGMRASELILMRAFLNNKQKRISIYKFYNSKDTLLKMIKTEE